MQEQAVQAARIRWQEVAATDGAGARAALAGWTLLGELAAQAAWPTPPDTPPLDAPSDQVVAQALLRTVFLAPGGRAGLLAGIEAFRVELARYAAAVGRVERLVGRIAWALERTGWHLDSTGHLAGIDPAQADDPLVQGDREALEADAAAAVELANAAQRRLAQACWSLLAVDGAPGQRAGAPWMTAPGSEPWAAVPPTQTDAAPGQGLPPEPGGKPSGGDHPAADPAGGLPPH